MQKKPPNHQSSSPPKYFQELISELCSGISDAIFALDKNGRFEYLNRAAEKLTGYRHRELVGQSFISLSPVGHNQKKQIQHAFIRQIAQGHLPAHEAVLLNKKGKIIIVSIRSFPIFKGRKIDKIITIATDLTAQKNTHRELQKFKDITDRSGHGLAMSDLKGRLLYVNRAFARKHGYRQSELLGKNLRLLHNRKQLSRVKILLGKLLQKGEFTNEEVWHIRKDGTPFPTLMSAAVILAEDKQPLYFFASVVNISKQKDAENKLRSIYSRYESLIKNAPSHITIIDQDFKIESINYTVPSLSKKDVIGKNVCDFVDPKYHEILQKATNRVFKTGKPSSFISQAGTPDQKTIWFDNRLSPIKKDGQVSAVAIFGSNISEQKTAEQKLIASEKKYSQLVENANDTIIIAQDGRFKYFNKKLCELTGYSPSELNNRYFLDLIHPEDHKLVLKNYTNRLKGVKTPQIYQFRALTKDRRVIWVEISAILTEWEGRPATLNFIRDITRRKEIEQSLQNLNEELESRIEERTRKLALSNKKLSKEIERRQKTAEKIDHLNQKLSQYTKKLDLKLKRIDEHRIPLTAKEKLAFWGLVRYPNQSSTELADILDMSPTTVNAIKKRLIQENYFETIYIPRLETIGCQVLSITYASEVKYQASSEKTHLETKKELAHVLIQQPELISITQSLNESIFIRCDETWETFMESQKLLQEMKIKSGLNYETFHVSTFNPQNSKIWRYLDFSSLLNNRFQLNRSEENTRQDLFADYFLKPSNTEKKLIYALMTSPSANVKQLAQKTGLSVPTVCKLRNKLITTGALKKINFPTLKKLGFELLLLNHYEFDSSKRQNISEYCSNDNVFFSISSKTEHISLALYEKYSDLEKNINHCNENCQDTLIKKPSRITISLENVILNQLNFLKLAEKKYINPKPLKNTIHY